MSDEREHIPVLLKKVLAEFDPVKGKRFIDATLGFGGHTQELLKEESSVLGIDWDPEVAQKTKKRLFSYCPEASLSVVNGNFRNLKEIAKKHDFCPVDGVLFDLGISRWHYKKAERGFSFEDEALDMRISPEAKQTAAEIVNSYSLEELNELFSKLVQEKLAKPIAEALVHARSLKPIRSGKMLANLIEQVYQNKHEKTDYHPATKVFLALRMTVNQELENLEKGLAESLELLKQGGKTLVITFHSGEDRLVKLFSKKLGEKYETKLIFPSAEEVAKNRLARSAKLRVIEKL